MYMYASVEFNFFKDKTICLTVSFFFLYITRDELNLVVLELKEDGTLHRLKRRWWQDKSQCAPDNQVCLYISRNYTDIKFN